MLILMMMMMMMTMTMTMTMTRRRYKALGQGRGTTGGDPTDRHTDIRTYLLFSISFLFPFSALSFALLFYLRHWVVFKNIFIFFSFILGYVLIYNLWDIWICMHLIFIFLFLFFLALVNENQGSNMS